MIHVLVHVNDTWWYRKHARTSFIFQSVHEHTTSELGVVGCLKSGSTSRNYDNIFLPKRDLILKKRNQILDLVFHLSINKQ